MSLLKGIDSEVIYSSSKFDFLIDDNIQFEFPKSEDSVVYFDTAGRSVLPKTVYESGTLSLTQKLFPWHGIGNKTEDDDIRELFLKLIGCPTISRASSDIAIVPSTGFAMTLVARNIAKSGILKQGKTVLILENEMGSVVYPWQEVCKQVGAKFKVIPNPFNDSLSNSNSSWMDLILQSIDDSVAVLSLPFVHWCNGSKVDLIGISKYLLNIDVSIRPLLVIDGTQSIGAINLNLADFYMQPCAIACSVHKWLNGPYGMSLLYVNKDFHDIWEPLDFHERGRMGSEEPEWDEIIFMNKESGFYPSAFCKGAKKFDSGGKKNPIVIPMVKAALKLILSWKPQSIQMYLTKLSEYLIMSLQNIFGEHIIVIPKEQRSGHIVGIQFSILSNLVSISLKTVTSNNYIANSNTNQKNVCKVLITGSTGWLGQHLYHYLLPSSDYIEVYAAYNKHEPFWITQNRRVFFNLLDVSNIEYVINLIKPDVIIHIAAMSSPAECQNNPKLAYEVNCPIDLIKIIKDIIPTCLFLFTSTDMVYDGNHFPYHVEGNIHFSPVNVYGFSKLDFEKNVLSLENGIVFRLSNMIGSTYPFSSLSYGNNKFLQWIYNSFKQRDFIGLKDKEVRSFVWIGDVLNILNLTIQAYYNEMFNENKSTSVMNMKSILSSRRIFNIGGPYAMSRLDIAIELCKLMNVKLFIKSKDDQEKLDKKLYWEVYILEVTKQFQNDRNSKLFENLNSPINISMNSSETELLFKIKFTDIRTILLNCL